MPATINTEDIMPTLLRLCGQAIPRSVEGYDFTPVLRGGPDPSGGATIVRCISPFGEYTRARGGREYRAVRTARHTYVRDLNGPWLLYDNDADPYQLRNLVNRPEHAALQARLEAVLTRKLQEQRDEFRPGSDYIRQWNYTVDPTGTPYYKP